MSKTVARHGEIHPNALGHRVRRALVLILSVLVLSAVGLFIRRAHLASLPVQVENVGGRLNRTKVPLIRHLIQGVLSGTSVERRHSINFRDSRLDDAWLRRNREQLASTPRLELTLNDRVSDTGLRQLRGLENIRLLILEGSFITDAGVKDLLTLQQLRGLGIARTSITASGLPGLCSLPHLDHLSVDSSQLTESSVAALASSPSLRGINIANCTDDTVMLVKDWTNLEELRLSGNRVTDASLPILSAMPSLEGLTLRATSITGQGLKNLENALPHCKIEVRQGELLYDTPTTSGPLGPP